MQCQVAIDRRAAGVAVHPGGREDRGGVRSGAEELPGVHLDVPPVAGAQRQRSAGTVAHHERAEVDVRGERGGGDLAVRDGALR